jgi:hypothetical protein
METQPSEAAPPSFVDACSLRQVKYLEVGAPVVEDAEVVLPEADAHHGGMLPREHVPPLLLKETRHAGRGMIGRWVEGGRVDEVTGSGVDEVVKRAAVAKWHIAARAPPSVRLLTCRC